jgi:hypothetical protein
MSKTADLATWVERHTPEQQSQIRWFADRVHAADGRIAEAIKWDRLTFTIEGNWHHWLCAVQATRRGVSPLLHKGALLDDPDLLLQGGGPYLRQVPFTEAAVRPEAVTRLVREAITHQTDL